MVALGIRLCLCACLLVFVYGEQYFSDWTNGTFLCTQTQSIRMRKKKEKKKTWKWDKKKKNCGSGDAMTCAFCCVRATLSAKHIKSDWALSLAVWNSSYPFAHRTLLAAVTGIDICLTASLSLSLALSHPPLPSPPSTHNFSVSLRSICSKTTHNPLFC